MSKKIAKKSGKISTGKIVAIGAGLAAVSAGAYALFGPNGKKNQKTAKVWMTKMEKEAIRKMKMAKNASMPMYHSVVDTLEDIYSKEYAAHSGEIKAFAKQLKSKWKTDKKELKKIEKSTKKKLK